MKLVTFRYLCAQPSLHNTYCPDQSYEASKIPSRKDIRIIHAALDQLRPYPVADSASFDLDEDTQKINPDITND